MSAETETASEVDRRRSLTTPSTGVGGDVDDQRASVDLPLASSSALASKPTLDRARGAKTRARWLRAIEEGTKVADFKKFAAKSSAADASAGNGGIKSASLPAVAPQTVTPPPRIESASTPPPPGSPSTWGFHDAVLLKYVAPRLSVVSELLRYKNELNTSGFISPPNCFFDEEKRNEALRRLRIMDTPAEQAFDNMVILATKLLDVPIAFITLIEGDRLWCKAKVGLDLVAVPRATTFCGWAIAEQMKPDDVFEIPNALEDERFKGNPFVANAPDIRFYAAVPIIASNGAPLGNVCVLDRVPKTLTSKHRQMLCLLARQVEHDLETRAVMLEMQSTLAQATAQNELTELLLNNALPPSTVNDLKHHARLPFTTRHDDVTVIAVCVLLPTRATPSSGTLEALSDVFCMFDDVVARHGLLKIKTFGTKYLATSGISPRRDNHALLAVQAAMEMSTAVGDRHPGMCARIGLHSGTVIAGVLGTTQLSFDVWGATVDIAEQIEALTAPGRVVVSQTTTHAAIALEYVELKQKVVVDEETHIPLYHALCMPTFRS